MGTRRPRHVRLLAVATVAGSLAGCVNNEPHNSRMAEGSEAVLFEADSPSVVILRPGTTDSRGRYVPRSLRVPVGTRVRVDHDASTDALDDRGVHITILEGEHRGLVDFIRRSKLRPVSRW